MWKSQSWSECYSLLSFKGDHLCIYVCVCMCVRTLTFTYIMCVSVFLRLLKFKISAKPYFMFPKQLILWYGWYQHIAMFTRSCPVRLNKLFSTFAVHKNCKWDFISFECATCLFIRNLWKRVAWLNETTLDKIHQRETEGEKCFYASNINRSIGIFKNVFFYTKRILH